MNLTAGANTPYSLRKVWMVMRLTSFFILILALHLSANTSGQNITISSDGLSMEKFFNQLQKQSGYSFILETGIVKHTVSVHVSNASLETVLDMVLQPLNLTYIIKSKLVYIINKTPDSSRGIVSPSSSEPPPIDIHGRVTDSLGNPLAGASITMKGSKRGTTTDANGYFTLSGAKENAILNISFTGYIHKEYKWTGESSFSIMLIRSNNPLDAVVVIPYGTTTQRLNTGDVSTVTAKTIEEQPVSNVLAALEGQVPGLVITQTTGAPGGSFSVQIRGLNSLTNNNDPFYVIDGVPYNSQIPSIPYNPQSLLNPTLNGTGSNLLSGNPLNYIDPYDIESVEILKDADATAIYGSRAANGAILITTKKGKAGRMQVDVNLSSGIQNPARDITLLNTQQYLAMRHEAFNNDGATPQSYDYDVNGVWDTTRYTDWSKVFLTDNKGHYTNAEASVSGGNTNTQYLFGAGYNETSTPFPTLHSGDGKDQKESIHFNLNTQSNDKRFKLSFTGNYVSDQNTVQGEDFSYDRLALAPDAPPLFNSDGSLNWAPLVPGQAGTWNNPYSFLNIQYKQLATNLVGNVVLSYSILPNWEVKTSLGYSQNLINEVFAHPTTVFDPGENITSGYSGFNTINSHGWIIEPQTNYKLQISRGLFSALLGGTFEANNSANQVLNAYNFISDALIQDPSAAGQISVNSFSSEYKYEAVFARLNYNWEDKYILNLTGRRDGSSRFGPGKQFGNFGALGAAWIFTKEKFIRENVSFLSFGKLRGSYGTSGNDGIGDYQYYDLFATTTQPYGGIQGLYPTNLVNPNVAWEINKKLEGGIELGFLKDRIILQASYYRNRSGNQLVSTPESQVTGFSSIAANLPALVQNTGKEFVLSTVNIKSKNFYWSSSVNLSINKNELLAFPNLANSSYSREFKIGQPLNMHFVYHMVGVNDTTGLYQFMSSQGNVTYTPNSLTDRITINTNPEFYGGFSNDFRYKTISVDFLFQFVKQIGQNLIGAYNAMPGVMANIPVAFLDRWQKPGDKTKYQQFSQNQSDAADKSFKYARQSDFAYSDASFIRLKNVAISWQLPERLKHQLGLSNARIYIQGQNLLTITHYNGIDPESQGTGLPPMRVFTAGFQLTL